MGWKRFAIICSIAITVIFLFSSCSKKDEDDISGDMSEEDLKEMVTSTKSDELPVITINENDEKLNEYNAAEFQHQSGKERTVAPFNSEEAGIKKPAGILCREKDILVLDQDSCSIEVLDYEGNCIQSIGQLGSGQLEFQSPTGLTAGGDKIYVIDSGNHRIQVLTQGLEFFKEIKNIELNTFDGTDYRSIAVDKEENIYLAGNLLMDRTIVEQDKNTVELHKILDNFYGSVYSKDLDVYAINRGQVFADIENKTIGIGYGKNNLFSLDGKKASVKCSLPDSLQILTFCIKGDRLYCISFMEKAVMSFDLTGNYIETVGLLEEPDNQEQNYYIDVDNNGSVYVSNTDKGIIYKYQ